MRILIDMQGAQSASRYRGIGRYSISLILAMVRNAKEHEIWLALNAAFPESVLDIRQQMQGLIPAERIRVFDILPPVAQQDPHNLWRAQISEKIREHFIKALRPDCLLITSLFEGYADDAVTTVKTLYESIYTTVIFYDLVPLLNPSFYLPSATHKKYYYNKINSLKKADLLLAISNYSRQNAIETLQFNPENVVTISSAANQLFKPKEVSSADLKQIHFEYGIKRKIILYVPGGFDVRKNFEGLITAYTLLPEQLRNDYQLVICSKVSDFEKHTLEKLRAGNHLKPDEIILTDYVAENDLVALYNIATLFVFPSKLEGFGLPILEAMSCGAAVIGANNSSIPEVIGCEDALFNADSPEDIKNKIQQALTDDTFRSRLKKHGLQQARKFSWNTSAQRALQAIEKHTINLAANTTNNATLNTEKLRLAFVSPLPPEKTGIADYSAELLPELLKFYDIDVITDQRQIQLAPSLRDLPRRSVEWFVANGTSYDRIIYQFGNSPFHTHMLGLLEVHPGIVVMHDFFLSGMLAYEETIGKLPAVWAKALYHSHGYAALQMRFSENGLEKAKDTFPCNLQVLQNAKGIIAHSKYSQQLANYWYGKNASENWQIIPQLYASSARITSGARLDARKALKIHENALLVCSFGFIAPTKLTLELINAWSASKISTDSNSELILVGANHGGDYGDAVIEAIQKSQYRHRIRITGWVDKETYNHYLQAADICVQLRTLSRGETSRAALECMSYGAAVIINANGSMAELPTDAVWMLPDNFTKEELINALETLWRDGECRTQFARRAHEVIDSEHTPTLCAKRYTNAIETIYRDQSHDIRHLLSAIAAQKSLPTDNTSLKQIAQTVAISCPPEPSLKQLLIDVSNIRRHDLKTGIERVVRAQLLELIENPPVGFRVEPVYFVEKNQSWQCWYAREFTLQLLHAPECDLTDAPVDIKAGDIFYSADFNPYQFVQAARSGVFLRWRALGVHCNVLVYDLLPILKPDFFPAGASASHLTWLEEGVRNADQLIGISAAVANELRTWIKEHLASHQQSPKISSIPLGADIIASAPTRGLPDNAENLLKQLGKTTSFLMVGTVEPRKGHWQALNAFEELWRQGYPVQLVLVGKEGWKHLSDSERRTIPQIVEKINRHPELNKRLFWLQEASDEYLQKIYAQCACLIAASEGEGFGLPIIEAAHHKMPIIARDLPVFREIAGQSAYYFSGLDSAALTQAIINWLDLYDNKKIPLPVGIKCHTWKESAAKLKTVLLTPEHDLTEANNLRRYVE